MKRFAPRMAGAGHHNYTQRGEANLARPMPLHLNRNMKAIFIVVAIVIASNVLSHVFFNPSVNGMAAPAAPEMTLPGPAGPSLYLMDKASRYVSNEALFEDKVREIAAMLNVPPEWLMAVMYSESQFDASVLNHKGSGATGLIQFMPATASDLNVSMKRLRDMNHTQQLEYVYLYLQKVRERYGEYDSLTDLYLAILYPKARKQDLCYTMYAKPSKSYKQNSGLDENKDGRVTVSDIDRRMMRLYPTAYNQSMERT